MQAQDSVLGAPNSGKSWGKKKKRGKGGGEGGSLK